MTKYFSVRVNFHFPLFDEKTEKTLRDGKMFHAVVFGNNNGYSTLADPRLTLEKDYVKWLSRKRIFNSSLTKSISPNFVIWNILHVSHPLTTILMRYIAVTTPHYRKICDSKDYSRLLPDFSCLHLSVGVRVHSACAQEISQPSFVLF